MLLSISRESVAAIRPDRPVNPEPDHTTPDQHFRSAESGIGSYFLYLIAYLRMVVICEFDWLEKRILLFLDILMFLSNKIKGYKRV